MKEKVQALVPEPRPVLSCTPTGLDMSKLSRAQRLAIHDVQLTSDHLSQRQKELAAGPDEGHERAVILKEIKKLNGKRHMAAGRLTKVQIKAIHEAESAYFNAARSYERAQLVCFVKRKLVDEPEQLASVAADTPQ